MCEYSANSLALIPSHTIHDEISFESTEVFFCLFECSEPVLRPAIYLTRCREPAAKAILDIFGRIREEYGRGYDKAGEMMDHLMAQLFIWTLRAGDSTSVQNDTLQYIHTYIKEYCTQKINFDILAETIGYSPSRLRHLYTEKFGQSMHQYQINSRINLAKELLMNTELTVNDVGINCGFRSTSKFIELFRVRCGLTPQKYRAIMNNPHEVHFNINL